LARLDEPLATRLKWCEDGLKRAKGSEAVETSLQLTIAELFLENKDYEGALMRYRELCKTLERRAGEYSRFRAELVAAQAYHKLGNEDRTPLLRSRAALERFHKQFSPSAWEVFEKRRDFVRAQKILSQFPR
jgi:hypothetical protein